jgi:hypothetical protein
MDIKRLPLPALLEALGGGPDLLICSASFETRCLLVPEALGNLPPSKSFIIANRDYRDEVGHHLDQLRERLGNGAELVETSTENPLDTADALMAVVDYLARNSPKSVLVDITTLTHEGLLILLRLLGRTRGLSGLQFAYANAAQYSVGDSATDKWLSKGVREVRTVLGYPGSVLPSRPTHLILLVGYEYHRALRLIEAIDPRTLSLGYGRSGSATTEKDRDANSFYVQLLKRMLPTFGNVSTFEIKCDQPLETRDRLLEEAAKFEGSNVVMAPMNNKMSTVGAALAAIARPEIQLCYAQAATYNVASYSEGGATCYLFDLPELARGSQEQERD